MARLADFCPSSDEDLPDLKTLLRKPSTRATRGTSTVPETEAKSLAPKSTSKSGTRRVRRLGEPSQSAPNPLFQRWNSEEPGSSRGIVEAAPREPRRKVKQVPERKPSKSPSDEESEDDEPQIRVRGSQRRRLPVIKDSDDEPREQVRGSHKRSPNIEDSEDETDKASGSDQEALLTRIRRLQRTRTEAVTKPKLEAKPQSSKTVVGEKSRSKASAIAKAWDSGSETERVSAAEADDPSIYQTAEEESSGLSSDSEVDDSPFRPQRDPAAKSTTGRKPSGTKDTTSLRKNSSLLQPTTVGQRKVSGTKKENVSSGQETAPSKAVAGPKDPSSKQVGYPKTSATKATAADLADTFAKLRLQLQDFSDDECKPPTTNELTTSPSTPPRTLKARGLKSPGKQNQIPQTPHRPSMDDFWSQDLVNDWNDQHSPRKLMLPPVAKSPVKQSPKKAPKMETKKAFAARKQSLAENFLSELDKEITYGRIAELAESAGGVKLVWSKTLNTTAGRANWRRETIRTRQADGTQVSVQFKHHASIELAEKVIDDEDRLLNVLAHEFCHLANFMISGVTNNPHGKEFKVWAAQCSRAFGNRGIEVTTKHSYEIDFKYAWECEECTTEFKRHSKSIDPQRHRCGSCKGLLRQTKPVPQAAGKTTSRYQAFVKEQMAVVRGENPGSPQKDVMKLIAVKWAKQGTSSNAGKGSKMGLVEKMVDLTLEEEV
ncbi:hypothetical protein AK830_g8012 [Neonectria ditissima]|uniref:SprT-like domain-containing protein n=1 Tax=Neonectria ditissima TaxID=78410 RepID=A0A0P7BDK0_9HYPO|nr:hypothetical protein AK830_g8012 [Neonectria ditissima]